jgi:hypothetical protein
MHAREATPLLLKTTARLLVCCRMYLNLMHSLQVGMHVDTHATHAA